jgi:hypothetical protein
MGLGDLVRRVFGSGREDTPDGDVLFLYLRCSACGEKLRLRLSRERELTRDYASGGYFVRKVAVGQRCFRPIEVRLQLDANLREEWREIEGGEFLTRELYEDEHEPRIDADGQARRAE